MIWKPLLVAAMTALGASSAMAQYAPPWLSYAATGNPANIVTSPQVAAALGGKVDTVNGASTGQTITAPIFPSPSAVLSSLGGFPAASAGPLATQAGANASAAIIAALGFTPYSAANPSAFISASGAPVQSVVTQTGAITAAQLYAALQGTTSGTLYPGTNPSNFITSAGAPVQSVAAQTGAITAATLAPLLAGTTSTTLAAGNDSRITGACQKSGCTFTGAITPQTTGGLVGTTAADSANAGSFGEFLSATNSTGTAMTTGTDTTLTSLSLTAGDWDVTGSVEVSCTGNAISAALGGFSLTSGGTPSFGQEWFITFGGVVAATSSVDQPLPVTRYNVSTNTTVYAIGYQNCGSGTLTGYAMLRARRVR